MKINGNLPDRQYFTPIASTNSEIYLWQDTQAPAMVIRSPVPNPWERKWDILFSSQKQKADRSKYPYRMQMRLYPTTDGIPATIDREWIKGVFAESNRENLKFIAFPIPKASIFEWIVYTISQ